MLPPPISVLSSLLVFCASGYIRSKDILRSRTVCSEPNQVPRLVSLLAVSYNPHVRYGAAVAIGIACAGSGMSEAVDLLETLTQDPMDFVRQGMFPENYYRSFWMENDRIFLVFCWLVGLYCF